jgi:hypothetical protein
MANIKLAEEVKKGPVKGRLLVHITKLREAIRKGGALFTQVKNKSIKLDGIEYLYQITEHKHPDVTKKGWYIFKAFDKDRSIFFTITVKDNHHKTFEAECWSEANTSEKI